MSLVSTEIYKIFEKNREKDFIFVRPGGNFGDELIYLGCEKIAKKLRLNYETVDYLTFLNSNYSENKVVYIHGGGGVNPYCSGKAISLVVKAINTHKGIVIVGPQTYHYDIKYLMENIFSKIRAASSQVYMFARDLKSLEVLQKCSSNSQIVVGIDHDTALNLDSKDFKSAKLYNKLGRFFLRKDREANNLGNIAGIFFLKNDPATFAKSFDAWIDLHSTAKIIITDRLHSAIAGKIFNKKVFLLSNIYHKNKSVWEYSLAQYPNINWSGSSNYPSRFYLHCFEKISSSRTFQKILVIYCLGSFSIKNYEFN